MECLKPVRIFQAGSWRSVPCGHCKACLNMKARKYTTMCNLESSKNMMTYFVTLTYSPEWLPRVEAFVGKKVIEQHGMFTRGFDGASKGIEVDSVQFISKCPRLTDHYKASVLDEVTDVVGRHYVAHDMMKPFENGAFCLENPYEMGVLNVYDVQCWLKRLRYYLQKEYDKINEQNGKEKEKVCLRYFAVGEYGPKKFRPHYHAMLYISQPKVAEILSDCVSKSWQYGRIDCQLSSSGEANGYCAKYINSLGYIPAALRSPVFKPFVLHSTFFGVAKDEELSKGLETLVYREFSERVVTVNGRLVEHSAPLSIQNYLFPKCYRYGEGNDVLNLVRYRFLEYVREAYTRDFFQLDDVDDNLRECIKDIPCSVLAEYYCNRFPKIFGFETNELFEGKCNDVAWRSRIVTALGISKRFLILCDLYRCSPWFYYHNIIKEYYKDKDYANLKKGLYSMELDFKNSNLDPKELIYRYWNLPRKGDEPFTVYDLDRWMRFACFARSLNCDPRELMEMYDDPSRDSRYIENVSLASKIYRDSVKHKEQNEINNVLYGKEDYYTKE